MLEPLDDLAGLIGQRELAGLGQIPALVLARRDPIDAHEDAEHQHHAGGGDRPVLHFPAAERARDVTPLREAVEDRDREPGERQALRPLRQFRPREANDDGGDDEDDAEPPEQCK